MRKRIKIFISITVLLALFFLAIIYCNRAVTSTADGKLYSDLNLIPHNHVGLLLGTGKYTSSGHENPFYTYRIDAAFRLMSADKIDYLIISGDNSTKDYNEPETMRDDLINAGIDSTRILLDYAGFRTFDSIVRLREIFSQDTVTIISQRFHNERALYIALQENITAIAFNAKDVNTSAGIRTMLREKLARVKVFLDYIFQTEPKFLGPKVNVP